MLMFGYQKSLFIFNVLSCSQYAHLFCIGCSLVFQSQSQNCTSASTVIWILWIFWGGNFGFLIGYDSVYSPNFSRVKNSNVLLDFGRLFCDLEICIVKWHFQKLFCFSLNVFFANLELLIFFLLKSIILLWKCLCLNIIFLKIYK